MLVELPSGGFLLNEITEEADAILTWVPNWSYIRGVEVGSLRGKTASVLLNRRPGLHLTCVDPFHTEGIVQESPEDVRRSFASNTAPYGDRCKLITLRSTDAVSLFNDGTACFVHIDALHDCPNVTDDLNAWWTKVRIGGILCGHDYGRERPPKTQSGTPDWGVKEAVDAWAAERRLKVHIYRFSWAIKREG